MNQSVLLIFLLFVFSCRQEKASDIDRSMAVDLETRDRVSLKQLFSRIEIIPLETNGESLFRNISVIRETGDRYYIMDNKVTTVWVFDKKGKFLFKIAHVGNGPGEYYHLSDFRVDTVRNRIELLAPINQAVFQYDLNGTFVEKISLPSIPGAYEEMCYLNADTIVFLTFDFDNRLKYYSRKQGKIVFETFAESQDVACCCTFPFIGENLFCRGLDNTVYRLEETGLTPAYTWDFGKYNNTGLEDLHRPQDPQQVIQFLTDIKNSVLVNYTLGVQAFGPTHIYAKLVRKMQFVHVLYNRTNGKALVFDKTAEGLAIHPFFMTGTYILGTHAAGCIEEVLNPDVLDAEEQTKLKALATDDNSVLIKYYF